MFSRYQPLPLYVDGADSVLTIQLTSEAENPLLSTKENGLMSAAMETLIYLVIAKTLTPWKLILVELWWLYR